MTPSIDHSAESAQASSAGKAEVRHAVLIINADDWGRDREVTDHTLECVTRGVVSSVSAMVFMEDSERAAAIAGEHNVDAGLHVNLTSALNARNCSSTLQQDQQKLARFLRSFPLCPAIYHPGLASIFASVVAAQLEEYERLYRMPPKRLDGHHHMHLCANVQRQKLLPGGTIARRNFSFAPGEKGLLNRVYRRWQDRRLARRHLMTDFFFSLPPIDPPGRLEKIFELATRFSVELETHPVNATEYEFLTGGALIRRLGAARIASNYALA